MEFKDKVKVELTEILKQYASGNAEVVRVYFSRPRAREKDIAWIKRQAARELTTAWKFLDNLKELRPKFDQGVGRRDYEGLARAFQEELEHYRLFADILEQELHEAVNPAELLSIGVWSEHKDLPENSKKARYERELRTSGDRLAKIALGIGEGGGSGWLIAGSRISGGPLEDRLARVMGEIAAEEVYHGPIHIAEAAKQLRTEEELEAVKRILREYLRYHLRMKNEQFGYPLPEARMGEIDEGRFEPLEGIDFTPAEQDRGGLAAYSL